MLKSYKEVHVSMWCCDLDRTYTLQKTCVWKTWSLCDDSVGEAPEAFEVASTKVTEGGGMWVFRDIFLMVLSSLSLFPVCCVFHITDCHNQDTLHKHMRPSRHGPNEPSGLWSKINLPFLKLFVLVNGSVLSNAVVSEDNDSHLIIPTFRHKYIYLILKHKNKSQGQENADKILISVGKSTIGFWWCWTAVSSQFPSWVWMNKIHISFLVSGLTPWL